MSPEHKSRQPLVPSTHTVPSMTACATPSNKDLVYFYLILKEKGE
jgi:hypothetical protein